MLPAEKNERWLMRVGIAAIVLLTLYIVFWVARQAYHSLHRIHKAYNVNVDEGRAPTFPPIRPG